MVKSHYSCGEPGIYGRGEIIELSKILNFLNHLDNQSLVTLKGITYQVQRFLTPEANTSAFFLPKNSMTAKVLNLDNIKEEYINWYLDRFLR